MRLTSYKIRRYDFGNVKTKNFKTLRSAYLLLVREGRCVRVDTTSCLCNQRKKVSISSKINKRIHFKQNEVEVVGDQNEIQTDTKTLTGENSFTHKWQNFDNRGGNRGFLTVLRPCSWDDYPSLSIKDAFPAVS